MHGIGGRTIEEAQQTISYPEYLKWVAFYRKRGSLHVGMRVEQGFGLLAAIYANSHSKNGGYKVSDFAPHVDKPPVTLEEAMKEWR